MVLVPVELSGVLRRSRECAVRAQRGGMLVPGDAP
jgi:hypothetical protein